ncbi:hypothetical protein DITRI_Ditri16bG0062600 [Diplodiscus trichospermus]
MSVCDKDSCEFQSPAAAENKSQPHPVSKKRTGKDDTSFRGVRKRKWGRYVTEIRLPGQKTRIWLGSFSSPEMAARAYDSAAFFLKGDSATLNFPNLVGSLPRPESCSRRDIQSAAAKAALQEPVGNVSSASDEDAECFGWWDDLGIASLEEVKGGPSLSPLSFDLDGELFSFMDHDNFITSCYEF